MYDEYPASVFRVKGSKFLRSVGEFFTGRHVTSNKASVLYKKEALPKGDSP
jgi:hypothetical protein